MMENSLTRNNFNSPSTRLNKRRAWRRVALLLVIAAFCLTGTAYAKKRTAGATRAAGGKKTAVAPARKNARAVTRRALTGRAKSAALLDKLAAIAAKLGVSPDAIELTRYAVKHPIYFNTVATHATAQDYAFFALVGAVKAAKGKNLPKIGQFTQKQCELPITLIDDVFAKADGYIDDANGKQKTNTVMGVAKDYAAQYAKAQTASAKEQVLSELTKAIPYFGEIKTICSFAFETSLQIERDIHKAFTEKAKQFQRAYQAFSSGSYGDGVAALLALGANAGIACEFVDSAVSGGLLGKTPILGSLAQGVCKGFVGAVIDGVNGIIKGVANTAKEAFCAVYSLFTDGCSEASPPKEQLAQRSIVLVEGGKPTVLAINDAELLCKTRGGLKNFSSKVPGKDIAFACNDNTTCQQKLGEPLRCATAQEKAAWEAQRKEQLQADLKNKLGGEILEINKRWTPQCPLNDQKCRTEIGSAANQAQQNIQAAAAADPTGIYELIKYAPLLEANVKAQQIIRDAEFRVLPQKWAADFNERYIDECKGSKQCVDKLNGIRTFILLGVSGSHKSNPAAPHSAMSPIYAEGEQAAINYFKTELLGDKNEDNEKFRKEVHQAVRDAAGREANFIELGGYIALLKTGEITIAGVYADAVAQMNKLPKDRTEMLNRAYLATMGRPAGVRELQYWQPRKESFKDIVQATRDYLYTTIGATDLRETVTRALAKQTGSRVSVPQIDAAIAKYKAKKAIFSEM